MANGLASGETFNQLVAQGFGPTSASYAAGQESAVANMFDAALFFQDDWKVNPKFTLSGGLRWEAQNHIADHDDWVRAYLSPTRSTATARTRSPRPSFVVATDFSSIA